MHTATTLADLLQQPVVELFKQDRKTRVWLTHDTQGQPWVLKRFNASPLYQRLRWMLKQHPAQRENLWSDRLIAADVPTVPVLIVDRDAQGHWHTASPYMGVSLYNWLRLCNPARNTRQRHDLTRQAAAIAGRLLRLRVRHTDFKASNLVLDTDGVLRLIDTGDCTGSKGTPLLASALAMLSTLAHNLDVAASHHKHPKQVRLTRTDRLRFYKSLITCWPDFPDGLQYLVKQGLVARG